MKNIKVLTTNMHIKCVRMYQHKKTDLQVQSDNMCRTTAYTVIFSNTHLICTSFSILEKKTPIFSLMVHMLFFPNDKVFLLKDTIQSLQ